MTFDPSTDASTPAARRAIASPALAASPALPGIIDLTNGDLDESLGRLSEALNELTDHLTPFLRDAEPYPQSPLPDYSGESAIAGRLAQHVHFIGTLDGRVRQLIRHLNR